MANPFGDARFLLSVAQLHQLPPADRPEIAFAGRSNAGKSSALNAICAQKQLARVSKIPGRTQLLNFFEFGPQAASSEAHPQRGDASRESAERGLSDDASAAPTPIANAAATKACGRLVDLPGYGFAQVPQDVRRNWAPLINGYLRRRETLCAIVLIMDIRHPLGAFDRQMLAWTREIERPAHILLTKSDKLSPGAARRISKEVAAILDADGVSASVQLFSAQDRTGVDEARSQLSQFLEVQKNAR